MLGFSKTIALQSSDDWWALRIMITTIVIADDNDSQQTEYFNPDIKQCFFLRARVGT